jgi:hypothetical protein
MDALSIIGINIRGGDAIVTQEHILSLRGMAFTAGPSAKPYVELIEAVEKYGEVRVWAEY